MPGMKGHTPRRADGQPRRQKLGAQSRGRMVAVLLALGRSHAEIAQIVGIGVPRVGMIASSPLMRLQVAEASKSLTQGSLDEIKQMLVREGMPTLCKLVDLRDAGQNERTQLGAARTLLDRIVPRKMEQDVQQRTIALTLDAGALSTLRTTMDTYLRAHPEMGTEGRAGQAQGQAQGQLPGEPEGLEGLEGLDASSALSAPSDLLAYDDAFGTY